MKNRYGLERAATNFKWWIIGVFSVIAIGTASAMYVGGELESALFEKLATDPTGTEGQVYYNTTEKKAKLYNGSAWTDFGSGDGAAGAGEINYNDDPDGASNWTELGDGVTVSTTVVETEIPRWPIKTQAVKLTNDTTGTSGWSVCVEVGEADRNKKLKIEWAQIISTSPAYSSGEFTYQLFSETNDTCTGTETGVTLHSSGTTSAVAIPAQNGVMYDEFDADDSQYYELKFVRASGASASFIGINDLVIGPGKLHSGAVVTAWEDASDLTISGFGTVTSNQLIKRRVGENLEVFGRFTTGTVAASTASIAYPNSDTLATILSANAVVGKWWSNVITATTVKTGTIYSSSSNVRFGNDDYTTASGPGTSLDGNEVTVSSTIVWVKYSVPLASYQGSGVLNTITQDNLSEWSDASVSVSGAGTSPTVVAKKRRMGDELELDLSVILNATPSGILTFTLPDNLVADTNKMRASPAGSTSAYWSARGNARYLDVSASPDNGYTGNPIINNTNKSQIQVLSFDSGGAENLWGTTNNAPVAPASGDVVHIYAKIPVTAYAGSQSSLVGFTAASETQSGLVSTGTQTFGGSKTFETNALYVDPATGSFTNIYFQNNDISETGFRIGIGSDEQAYLVNSENTDMNFWTNDISRMTIASDGNVTINQNLKVTDFLRIGNESELTISSGTVTATSSYHTIDTEGDAATDDLTNINGCSTASDLGKILILRTATSARDTTVKDSAGNLQIAGDFAMSQSQYRLVLMCSGTTWFELSRSVN